MNYIDFIKENLNKTFEELAICELDFAIFSEIVYLPLDMIDSDIKEGNPVSLSQVATEFIEYYQKGVNINPYLCAPYRIEMIELMNGSLRYGQLELFNYADYIDERSNFTAVTIQLNESKRIIAYRGTTDSVIGWKENFNLAIGKDMPSQQLAYKYLLNLIDDSPNHYYLTGHSKGANLAVYSSLQLETEQTEAIKGLYLYDGPGFDSLEAFSNHPIYTEKKINHYIPNYSIVGLLLNHTSDPIVVECQSMSLLHHITNLWEVEAHQFKRAHKLSASSELFHYVSTEWLKITCSEDRKRYIDSIFNLVLSTGFQSLVTINSKPIDFARKIIHEYHILDDNSKDFIGSHSQILRNLANQYYESHKYDIDSEHVRLFNIISIYRTISNAFPPLPSLSNIVKKIL